MSWTLGSYIARRFLTTALFAFAVVVALIVVIDLVERLNQNSDGRAGFANLVGMALLNAPSIALVAAPFTVLLAAMACFARLARSSELVVTRAAGVSVWSVLAPAVLVAVLLGTLSFAVYNPVASAFAKRFEALEEKYFGRSSSSLSVSADGLWLRQTTEDADAATQTVIHAERASSTIDRLWDVTVFRFTAEDRMTERLQARTAVLERGTWRLNVVQRWRFASAEDQVADAAPPAPPTADDAADDPPAAHAQIPGTDLETRAEQRDMLRIATDLTPERIIESFAAPETIGFWQLPSFIGILEDSGFSAGRHRLHWHRLVSLPVVFAAMVLIGAAFSMRPLRMGGLGGMALGCVMTGFGYFFLSDLAQALGASGAVPVTVAAKAKAAQSFLLNL
ncbi:MAG: LptF/LptG family permease, partial [Pseudomonadota bacterium]